MTLNVVSICSAGSDEISVGVEITDGAHYSKEKLIISTSAYTRLQLQKGECKPELYEELAAEAKIHLAFKRALYILGYGACSQKRLVSKLISKGFAREDAEEAAARAAKLGFIDDISSATREAEISAAKLWGEIRIRAALSQKGYSKEVIDSALFSLEDSGIDFLQSCKELIRRRYGSPPSDRAEAQKMISALMRYGYTLSQIKAACSLFE